MGTANYFKTVDPSTLPDVAIAPYGGKWGRKGRGSPDVSALDTGYTTILEGKLNPGVVGTSASTPVFAAMIALINDVRLSAGKPPLGFLNPLLYSNSDAFTDVTIGSNRIGRAGQKLDSGFNCTKGWDPVTGLGSPIYPKLLKAAMGAVLSEAVIV